MPLFLVFLVIILAGTAGIKMYSDRARRIQKIRLISDQAGVNPALALAIAEQENKFQTGTSSDGLSAGIFQIKPSSAKQVLGYPVTLAELNENEDINIKAGILYIKWLNNQFYGDSIKTIAAYNHGIGNVKAGRVDFSTDNYVRLVSGYKAGWERYLSI